MTTSLPSPTGWTLCLQTGNPLDVLEKTTLQQILLVLLIVLCCLLVIQGMVFLSNTLGRKVPRTRFFFNILVTIGRFLAWFMAFLMITQVISPSRETFLAIIATVGIALGLGAQDLVKSVIGGLIILVNRPFQLGDRVKIGNAYGEIDHIGLLSTKLTTPDDTRVTIPNSEILTSQAWNANSGVPSCQVVVELYLPPDADPVAAVEIARESALSSPYLLLSKPVVVLAEDGWQNGPFMLLKVKCYVYDHRYEKSLSTDVFVRAKSVFRERGMLGR